MKRLIPSAIISGIAFIMTACTTEEIVSGPGIDVTVNVNSVPGSRADAIEVPEGYSFKCIMQLVKDDGTKVKQETADVSAGKVSFKILGEDIDRNGVSQALFWAEYVPASGTKVYNTDDLTNVTYTTTSFDLSKAAEIKACEAFAGTLAIDRKTSASTASVKLTRPMSLVSFCPKNADNLAKAKTIAVNYSTFNGYNVKTKSCAGNDVGVTMTNSSFASTATPWWQIYIFAPEGKTKIDKDIKFSLTGEGMVNFEHTIAANTLPLSANKKYNVTATLTSASTADINVEVTVDPNWTSEEDQEINGGGTTPENPDTSVPLALGVMVDNQGRGTTDASKAVGMVIQMGPYTLIDGEDELTDDLSNYPSKYEGKAIKAYALAFTSLVSSEGRNVPISVGTFYGAGETLNNLTGALMSEKLLTKIVDSPVAIAFDNWTTSHVLTGDKVTEWYIPSKQQTYEFCNAIINGSYAVPEGSGALYAKDDLFAGKTEFFIMSSSQEATSGYQVWKWQYGGNNLNVYASGYNAPESVICYPMFTIFE